MISVFGHKGFIGSQVVSELQKREIPFYLPERDEDLTGRQYGKLIYCIGLTADAKKKPFDTIQAHINKLSDIIRTAQFDEILYASSTRVYVHGSGEISESDLIQVNTEDPFELFNLTKLTGESLLINTVPNSKVIRYSNVYGVDKESENFLTAVIKEALNTGNVNLQTTPDSSKDYISVFDAARLTVDIAMSGKQRIYNVASGFNIRNSDILAKVRQVTGCTISYSPKAQCIRFPRIDNTRITNEFGFIPSSDLLEDISLIIKTFIN